MESAVGRGHRRTFGDDPVWVVRNVHVRRQRQLESFQNQACLGPEQGSTVAGSFPVQLDDWVKAWSRSQGKCSRSEVDRRSDKRPIAAHIDGVAIAGALHRLGQGIELANLDALEPDEGERL